MRETPPPAPPETRLEIVTPATDQPTSFALSPDGRQIVFVASGDGASRLWLRSLATTTAQPLAGTEGATSPFWSPDGRSIGFFAGGALKRLDLGGGAPQTLAPADQRARRDVERGRRHRVCAERDESLDARVRHRGRGGGRDDARPAAAGHVAPHFLPDGRRFLFYVRGAPDTAGIYLGALDGSAPTRLTPADSAGGLYLPSGWLLWVRAGTLVAQRLDLAQAALTGEPVTLADGVAVDGSRSAVSVAATGLVAYRTGAGSQRQLTWVDRSGTARGTVGDPDGNVSESPRVARRPSRGRGRARCRATRTSGCWTAPARAASRSMRLTMISRLVARRHPDRVPLEPDGSGDLYQKLTSGAGVEERLVASDQIKVPSSWSADGRFLLYHSIDPQTNGDLWVVPMAGRSTRRRCS